MFIYLFVCNRKLKCVDELKKQEKSSLLIKLRSINWSSASLHNSDLIEWNTWLDRIMSYLTIQCATFGTSYTDDFKSKISSTSSVVIGRRKYLKHKHSQLNYKMFKASYDVHVNMTHISRADSFCFFSRNWAKLLRFFILIFRLVVSELKNCYSIFSSFFLRSLEWFAAPLINHSTLSIAVPMASAIILRVNVDDLDDMITEWVVSF